MTRCSACGRTEGPCPLKSPDCPVHGEAMTQDYASAREPSRRHPPGAYLLVSLLSACSAPLAPSVPDSAMGVEMAVACKGDRVSALAVTAPRAGSFVIPVDVIAEKYCKGA